MELNIRIERKLTEKWKRIERDKKKGFLCGWNIHGDGKMGGITPLGGGELQDEWGRESSLATFFAMIKLRGNIHSKNHLNRVSLLKI